MEDRAGLDEASIHVHAGTGRLTFALPWGDGMGPEALIIGVLAKETTRALGSAVARYFVPRTDSPERDVPGYQVTGRREIDRYSEPIGDDTRVLDNLRSDVEFSRAVTIANSVERQFKTDVEQATARRSSGSIGLQAEVVTAALARHFEESYKKTLSETASRQHSVEEKLEFRIPPRTALTIVLKWKRIWQRGEISVASSLGQSFVIPYQESVGLEFDVDTATTAE